MLAPWCFGLAVKVWMLEFVAGDFSDETQSTSCLSAVRGHRRWISIALISVIAATRLCLATRNASMPRPGRNVQQESML